MLCPICKQALKIIKKEEVLEDDLPQVNKYAFCGFCKKQWKLNKTTDAPKPGEKKIKIVGEDESAPPLDLSKLATLFLSAQGKQTVQEEASPKPQDSLHLDSFQEIEFDFESNRDRVIPKSSDGNMEELDHEEKNENMEELNLEEKIEKMTKLTLEEESRNKAKSSPRKRNENKAKSSPREKGENRAKSSPRERDENRAKSSPREKGENRAKSSPREKGENRIKSSPRERDENRTKSSPREKGENRAKPSPRERGENKAKSSPKLAAFIEGQNLPKSNISLVKRVLGILSILAFAFFFFIGVTNSELAIAISCIALGIFCLGAGILQLFTHKSKEVPTFVFPALLYIIGGMIAFLNSEESTILLFGAISTLVMAIALVILGSLVKNEKA